jgi:hypothetical protein
MESDLVEEETVLQIHGSLFWIGFLIWGLLQSWVGFRVSSSSNIGCMKMTLFLSSF